MKKNTKRLVFTGLIFFGILLLSGCSTISASSWPGVTYDGSDNTIYVAHNTGVYALNSSNGTQKWRYPAEAERNKTFYASPVLTEDGQLLVGGYDNILYNLDAGSGSENWSFAGASNRYIASPLVLNGNIYAPNADERMYALDSNGNSLWSTPFSANQALWGSPAATSEGDALYVASMDRNLYAINPENGTIFWSKPLQGASVGTPTIDEQNNLFIGNFANQMLAFENQGGSELWTLPTAGWVWSGPSIDGDLLFFGDLEGNFYAVDKNTGTITWQIQPDGQVVGQPLVTEERVYFGTESGTFYAVDLRGNIVWSKEVGGSVYSGIVGDEDLIVVAPYQTDNLLIAFNAEGNQLWTFTPDE